MPTVSQKAMRTVMDAIWCASEDLDIPELLLEVATTAPGYQPLPLIVAVTLTDDFRSGLTIGHRSPFDALRETLIEQRWVSTRLIEKWRALALVTMSCRLGVLEEGQHEFLVRRYGSRLGLAWHLAAVRTIPADRWPQTLHAEAELLGLHWGYPHGPEDAAPQRRAATEWRDRVRRLNPVRLLRELVGAGHPVQRAWWEAL